MGQPVVHWEFWSEDPARIAEFYRAVFGWNIRPLPALNYQLVEPGGSGGINGGIMKPQAGPWPAKLALYIDVDDLDRFRGQDPPGRRKDPGRQDGCPRGGSAVAVRGSGRASSGNVEAAEGGSGMIRKLASGEYRLYSRKKDPRTGKRRNLGTFKTRAAAEKHERAVQYYKRRG